jgi:hypothetical protein
MSLWNQGGGGPKKFGNHCGYIDLVDNFWPNKDLYRRHLGREPDADKAELSWHFLVRKYKHRTFLLQTLLVLLKTAASLVPGATFHSAAPGIYFQYVNVPGQNEYIFGFSRGNPDHHISRYEHGKGSNFEAKVTDDTLHLLVQRVEPSVTRFYLFSFFLYLSLFYPFLYFLL